MKKINILTIFLLSFLCCCCRAKNPELNFDNGEPINMEIYDQGNLVRKFNVASSSPKITTVKNLLKEKNGEWKSSAASYAPLLRIKSISYNINFQKHYIILNFKDSSGNYRQLVSNLSPEQFIEAKSAFDDDIN